MSKTVEGVWLSAADPITLWYAHVARRPRKRRLVACACARRVLPLLPADPRPVALIAACERFADAAEADGPGAWKDVVAARRGVRAFEDALERDTPSNVPSIALEAVLQVAPRHPSQGVNVFMWAEFALGGAEKAVQLAIIRDVFGNPFRPVAFAPAWRTGTAVSLARGMYASRDFGAMPILADALQDAGCDRDDVLTHCRAPGEHVRGCWAVDLVLGKE